MFRALARGRVHYGWIIVAVTFLTMLGAAGIRSTPGVLMLPLEQEFGWDRATLSLAVSINLVLFGLCGPFAAAVMERVGMRATMAGALLLLASAVGLTTWMSAPWHLLLLWGVLVGLGSGTLSGWVAAGVAYGRQRLAGRRIRRGRRCPAGHPAGAPVHPELSAGPGSEAVRRRP